MSRQWPQPQLKITTVGEISTWLSLQLAPVPNIWKPEGYPHLPKPIAYKEKANSDFHAKNQRNSGSFFSFWSSYISMWESTLWRCTATKSLNSTRYNLPFPPSLPHHTGTFICKVNIKCVFIYIYGTYKCNTCRVFAYLFIYLIFLAPLEYAVVFILSMNSVQERVKHLSDWSRCAVCAYLLLLTLVMLISNIFFF